MDFSDYNALEENIGYWNKCFSDKGVELLVLKKSNGRALIYVCRKKQLQTDLDKPGVRQFLADCGYLKSDVDYALRILKNRLECSQDGFPHEIGVFLGYPLQDVVGFIENAGQNCKCVGCWKVYCNECEAVKLFGKYKKCKDVYIRLWRQGRSVRQLTVAV